MAPQGSLFFILFSSLFSSLNINLSLHLSFIHFLSPPPFFPSHSSFLCLFFFPYISPFVLSVPFPPKSFHWTFPVYFQPFCLSFPFVSFPTSLLFSLLSFFPSFFSFYPHSLFSSLLTSPLSFPFLLHQPVSYLCSVLPICLLPS